MKPNKVGERRNMSFQTKLNERQNIEVVNVNGNIDATKHKSPLQALQNFIQNAPRGSQAIYCRGPFLVAYSLGEFARRMHLQGHCYLVQRRIRGGRSAVFEYLMVKR